MKVQSPKQRRGYKDITGTFWCGVKSCANTRQIPFDLTIREAWDVLVKQNFKCALTNEQLILYQTKEEKKQGIGTASIDRIDSSKGYTKDNIQWVHKDINFLKGNRSNNKFIEWCHKIRKYNAVSL